MTMFWTRQEGGKHGHRSPNNTGSTERLGRRAPPNVGRGVANSVNVGENPSLNEDLRDCGNSSGRALSKEHKPRRYLHIVPNFHVANERHALRHRDVTVCLEDHHRNGFAGNSETDDQLGDDVETDLLVGDGLDHTDGEGQDNGDGQGKEECPNWHACRPGVNRGDTQGKVD